MPNTSSASAAHRRIIRNSARTAVREWLRGLHRAGMYLFEVNGVECALEYFTGHWNMEEGGRWRWGRVGADPDEDFSSEDVLLEVALGRKLPPQPMSSVRRRRDFPVYGDDAELTGGQVEQRANATATVNLNKLTLRRLPPI